MGFFSSLGSAFSSAASGGVLGNWDGGWSTYSSGKSRTKYAAETALRYGLKSLEESPSSARKGLEDAGFNPLLAVGSGIGSSSGLSGSFAEPNSSSAAKLDLDGFKGFLSGEKKDMARNEVKKGEETNELIKAQKENVEEETRGKKIENDLKRLGTTAKVLGAASVAAGVGVSAYKAAKTYSDVKHSPVGFAAEVAKKALESSKSAKAAAIASKAGRLLRKGVGMFLPPVVFESLGSIKRGYDQNKSDPKKMMNFVKALRLGVVQ